jgi:DNA-directed RNA polymerase subunit RPC12/RpoP
MDESVNPHKHDGLVKTDMHCHNCSKSFIAQLDYRIDGNQRIECPHCRHIHFRVIKDGIVTGERYSSDAGGIFDVEKRRIWKAKDDVLQVQTSSAGMFIRQSWLNKEG